METDYEIDGPYDWTDYNFLTLDDLINSGELVTLPKMCSIFNIKLKEAKVLLKEFTESKLPGELSTVRYISGRRKKSESFGSENENVIKLIDGNLIEEIKNEIEILNDHIYGISKFDAAEGATNSYILNDNFLQSDQKIKRTGN